MPTGVYVRKNSVWDRLKAGMAAGHADDFAQWLRQRRYTPLTIRRADAAACVLDALGARGRLHARCDPRGARGLVRLDRSGTSTAASAATSTRTQSSAPSCSSPALRNARRAGAIAAQIRSATRRRVYGLGPRAARPGRDHARRVPWARLRPSSHALGGYPDGLRRRDGPRHT